MRYAGFWIRVVAAIVDAIVLCDRLAVILLALPADPMPPLPENPDCEALIEYGDQPDLASTR